MYPGIKSNFYTGFTKKPTLELQTYIRRQTLRSKLKVEIIK